jgi:bifunctional DNase/RNase
MTARARSGVEVQVAGLTIDPYTNMPVVILKDHGGRYQLPIWIGLVEASAIATQLENIQLARPMTHDLMKTLLERVSATVERVEVTELKDETFFASLVVQLADGGELVLDSRPSDAIAIALRTGAKIFVAEEILQNAKAADLATDVEAAAGDRSAERSSEKMPAGAVLAGQPPSKWAEILANLSPEDFGKFKM